MTSVIPPPVSNMTAEAVRAKAEAARSAAETWRRYSLSERVALLRTVWADLSSRRSALLKVIHDETSKPFAEIETMEIDSAELIVRYYTSNAHRILQDQAAWRPWLMLNKRAYTRYIPRGVVGLIAPWNMPFLIPFGDAFAAMLAGNAVVLKPSEWTTRTALWLEEAVRATGMLPDGLLGVATGDGSVGAQVAAETDMVLFTGSTRAGRSVAQACAAELKPCVLELGGKHPMIVFKDAAIERAAKAAVWGAFANCGQLCVGVERVYVESEVHDKFVEAVRREMSGLRQGLGGDVDVGRLIFPPQLKVVKDHLADAKALGAHVIGGDCVDEENLLIQPALVLKADHRMRLMNEETFGPVLPIMKVERGEEGVRLSNAGPFGLSGSIWTTDIGRAERLGLSLETGLLGINDVNTHYAVVSLPFSGIKQSGLGRRHSDEGLRMFCRTQSVYIHEWPAAASELWWFPYEPVKTRLISWLTRWS